jgi:hypothetical protein
MSSKVETPIRTLSRVQARYSVLFEISRFGASHGYYLGMQKPWLAPKRLIGRHALLRHRLACLHPAQPTMGARAGLVRR